MIIEHSIESIYRIDYIIISASVLSALVKTLCIYNKRRKKNKELNIINLIYTFLSSIMTAFLFVVVSMAYSDEYLHMIISGIVGSALGTSSIKILSNRYLKD